MRKAGEVLYSDKFEEAFSYAARCHKDQIRKGTTIPYITHLMAVAAIVGENGGTEEEVIAALLHDVPEDQGGRGTLKHINDTFGEKVAEIVEGCTDTFEDPKPEWWARKKNYIAHLVGAPESVRLVSAADKLANARNILADLRVLGDTLWDRFTGGKEGTLWYYRSLVCVYKAAGSNPVVEELDQVVHKIGRLANDKPNRRSQTEAREFAVRRTQP